MTTSVFVLDDHEVLRRGLRSLLTDNEDLCLVGEAATAAEALAAVPALRPDVTLLDVRLPDGDGIDVCRHLVEVDFTALSRRLALYSDRRDEGPLAVPGAPRSAS